MHRTRKVLAATFLVVLGTFAFASVAGAAEGGFESKEAEECHKLLEEGKKVDDCQEAPSPILPATNELIWGGISFVVLLVLLSKFAFPAIKKGMDDRTERIRKDLDEAESAKSEADRIREDYSRQLADAKAEAGRIIEEARQAADAVRRDLTARAEQEAQELRQRNAEQLDAERARLMGEIRGQVSTLAIELAEKVVEANLDQDANTRLIESYIAQVGEPVAMANDDRIDGYANALFEVASVEGSLDAVENELFQVARALETSDELRTTLTDAAIPVARRQSIIEDLLNNRASSVTVALVSFVVASGRAHDLPAIIDRLVARAAQAKNKVVAEVRTAVPLTDDQRTRLADALGKATGKSVEVKAIVDRSVLGGVVAQIGDTVIDGSVRSRLEQLREAIG